jgi:hypothetical protein
LLLVALSGSTLPRLFSDWRGRKSARPPRAIAP